MKVSIPTCTPQAKTSSDNDCWLIGTRKYHTLLSLTQWEWQIFQSFWLSCTHMEQRGQADPAQMKLLPLLSDPLDLFLEGKTQVSSSIDSHNRWTECCLKKKLLNILPRTLRSLPTMEGEGGRDLPCRTTRKLPSFTCIKLSVRREWIKHKTGATVLSSTNLGPTNLWKSNLQRFREKPCSLHRSFAGGKSLLAYFHESHLPSLVTFTFFFSFQSHNKQSQEIRIRYLE